MASLGDLRTELSRHRAVAELSALLAFACIVFGGLGIASRRRLASIRGEAQQAATALQEVASFRSSFRAGTSDESVRLQLPDSLQLAVRSDVRVSLAEHVATLAETAGLKNVRVWFVQGADSAAPPPPPDFVEVPVSVANYTLAVDCDGSYGAVLSLIRELPPSLAFERFVASGTGSTKPRFHITLDVFDSDASVTPDAPARHG